MFKCQKCNQEFKNNAGLANHENYCKAGDPVQEIGDPTGGQVDFKATMITKEGVSYNTKKWEELPPPIKEHLKMNFGSWLNYFEIGQEWKKDHGGFSIYIKIPKEFSTEWKTVKNPIYDNQTMKMTGQVDKVIEDIRSKPLRDMAEVVKWLIIVKRNIIENAYRKGIRLPTTNTPVDETKQSYDEYRKSLAGTA